MVIFHQATLVLPAVTRISVRQLMPQHRVATKGWCLKEITQWTLTPIPITLDFGDMTTLVVMVSL